MIILEIFCKRICLNLVLLLLLLLNFVSASRLELMYISIYHNHVKPHSFLWFLVAFAASISYRNNFFRLYQHNILRTGL